MKYLILVFYLGISFFCSAQNVEGSIVFQKKDVKSIVTGAAYAEPLNAVFELNFSNNKSSFRRTNGIELSADASKNKSKAPISSSSALDFATFVNDYAIGESTSFIMSDDKCLGLLDSIPKYNWIILDDKLTIAGYACTRAKCTIKLPAIIAKRGTISNRELPQNETSKNVEEAVIEGREIEIFAWFTTELKLKAGPEKYNGLPGMILGVNIDNGATEYMAQKVSLVSGKIEIPKDIQYVNRKTFGVKIKELFIELGKKSLRDMGY